MALLQLFLSNPTKVFFDGEVASATILTLGGAIQVLPHHENIISSLDTGVLEVVLSDGSTLSYFINGGSLAMRDNKLTLLTLIVIEMKSSDVAKQAVKEFTQKQEQIDSEIKLALNQGAHYTPSQNEEYLYAEERLDKIKLFSELLEN